MPTRRIKKRPLKKVSTGDMRERISFYNRAIAAPTFNSATFTEAYTLLRTVWASVETLSPGQVTFADIDVGNQPTHLFKTRFWSDINTEIRIKWKDNNYEITKKNNPEERGEYLFLWAKLLGDDTLQGTQ
jgi:head-tail adaptor